MNNPPPSSSSSSSSSNTHAPHSGEEFNWVEAGIGCGRYKIPKVMFKKNRDKLFDRFDKLAKEGKHDDVKSLVNAAVFVQGGAASMQYDTDHEHLFRQESNFYYLFGVNEPDFYGALDFNKRESLLFIPRLDADYQLWCGKIHPPAEYKAKFGVDAVYFTDEITSVLKERKLETLHIIHGQNIDSKAFSPPVHFKGMEEFKVNQKHACREICECRVFKTAEELDLLRWINKMSSEAHIDVMKKCRPGMFEYQLEAMFKFYTSYHYGSRYDSYTCICCSGANGAVLHYGHSGAPNEQKVNENTMLLLDMGAEYECYCSDITCSFPSNGRFTPEQKLVYQAVLDAQRAVIAAMKPGVRWSEMHRLAERVILEHLIKNNFILPKGKSVEELHRMHIPAFFMPHGLGHLLGLSTHDVGGYPEGVERVMEPGIRNLRTNRILQPGMVLTVEPGIYFVEEQMNRAMADPQVAPHLNSEMIKKFLNFGGVRLEDDVVVTETGCENLTTVPRTIEDIERVMAEGLLEEHNKRPRNG